MMRSRSCFTYLSGLVFLAYLFFGFGGAFLSTCCPEERPRTACSSPIHPEIAVLSTGSAESGEDHSQPCFDDYLASAGERVHLSSRSPVPRYETHWEPPSNLARRLYCQVEEAAGIFHARPQLAQKSVLRELRTIILLI